MKTTIPLLFLGGIFTFTIWLAKRAKRLNKIFWADANRAGFDRPAELPAALQKTRPYLFGRAGSPPRQIEGTLLLVGSTPGAIVPIGNGATTQTISILLGFLLPPLYAIKDPDLPQFRKSHPRTATLETLPDGSQLFLWGHTLTPKNLAKVLAAMQDAIKLSSRNPAATTQPIHAPEFAKAPSVPSVAQAVTERIALKGAHLKRYYAAGHYRSKDPAIETYVKGIFSCEADPTVEDFDRGLLEEAKKGFAWIKHPEAEPTHAVVRTLHKLPLVPLPPEDDQRPLLHWKITGGIDCPDVKRGYSLCGVFGWPERPPAAILHDMVMLLAIDSLVKGDNSPENAEYGYLDKVNAAPTSDPLTHPEQNSPTGVN